MHKKNIQFKSLSKILLAIGIGLLLAGGIVTTIEAAQLDYIPYETYAKEAGIIETPKREEKVLEVAIAEGCRTLGIDLSRGTYDYKINNDLENTLRITYETSLNNSDEPLHNLILDAQIPYDTHVSEATEEVSEPVVTLTYQGYYDDNGKELVSLWLEQLKEGVVLIDGPSQDSTFKATIEMNQSYYDKLDVTAIDYDRIRLK